jgi:hypothetical protein
LELHGRPWGARRRGRGGERRQGLTAGALGRHARGGAWNGSSCCAAVLFCACYFLFLHEEESSRKEKRKKKRRKKIKRIFFVNMEIFKKK